VTSARDVEGKRLGRQSDAGEEKDGVILDELMITINVYTAH